MLSWPIYDWLHCTAQVKVTLRLAVYRQSVRIGVKPLETQRFFFQRNSWGDSPYVTPSLTIRWVCHLWICLDHRQVYIWHIYHVIENSFFALHTSPLSVQALQSRACLSRVSYATTASLVTWTILRPVWIYHRLTVSSVVAREFNVYLL
jgi:hypothetical protein